MDGSSKSATELAVHSEVTPQTASSHLARLVEAGILRRRRDGRNRYYELAGVAVADTIELLEELAAAGSSRPASSKGALQPARTCYDHLAGRLGVALTASLRSNRYLRSRGSDFELTRSGRTFLKSLGVDVEQAERRRRLFARQCLDWTERRPHLGGALGAAFADRCFELGWVRRTPGVRAVVVTRAGDLAFRSGFDLPSWTELQAS